jgi:alkyl hydroperoxide reductase subunit AhpC
MKRIGDKALTFRLPTIVDGALTFIDPDEFLGQWVVLSFVPTLGEFDSALWNEQGKDMESLGAQLLVVPVETQPLHQQRPPCTERVHFKIVGDPLGRLKRLYGNPTLPSVGRGRTFLIDPDGWLRFHLVHSLSERGMGVLRELLQACQDAEIAVLE